MASFELNEVYKDLKLKDSIRLWTIPEYNP